MAGREIMTYKGEEITYLDYRGKEIKALLAEAVEQALKENKQRYLLTNITGVFAYLNLWKPSMMQPIKPNI